VGVKELAVKLAALFSYCGGPLYVADLLKPRIGTESAFLITFLPVGIMVLGAFFMDDAGSRWLHPVVRAGRLALYVVLAMNMYAIWCFALGVRTPDQVLHYIGLAVGAAWAVYYLRESRRWARKTDALNAPDPTTPKPIEPA